MMNISMILVGDIEKQMIIENAKNEAELIHQQILGNLNK